jgi:signal transduction histidine kinase/FixJ family two-component response regulator
MQETDIIQAGIHSKPIVSPLMVEEQDEMGIPLRVLIVEDSENDALLIVRALQHAGYDAISERVDTMGAFGSALAGQPWDVIISDYKLPGLNGLDALSLLHKSEVELPFIFVSDTAGENIAVLAMKAGAYDYVMKDNLVRLGPAVQRGLYEVEERLARRQAEEALRQRNRELALLNRASQAFSATLDLDQVLVAVLEEVRRLMHITACSVWLIDWVTGELICQEATGPGNELVRGWHLPPGDGLAGWVVQNNTSLITPDTQADVRHFKDVDKLTGMALRSILSTPLRANGQVVGVLQVSDTAVDRFKPEDLTLMESLAATAGIAIENARLYSEEQQRTVALARALDQQKELDRLKSEFIRNVSHELRTPLALIFGYADLLDNGDLGELQPDQQEPVAVIARRSRMLHKMVDDLMALMETETQSPKRHRVDVADLTQNLLVDFQVAAQQAGLTLVAEIASGLPPVSGDPEHLTRVLDNLLGNALKFTPAGGQIGVHLWRSGTHLVLTVSDTGIGIPHDQLDRIFERFYQVDGSVTRRYGGTGLGLALVKEIVEAHGGKVGVKSKVDGGATFAVTLPTADR